MRGRGGLVGVPDPCGAHCRSRAESAFGGACSEAGDCRVVAIRGLLGNGIVQGLAGEGDAHVGDTLDYPASDHRSDRGDSAVSGASTWLGSARVCFMGREGRAHSATLASIRLVCVAHPRETLLYLARASCPPQRDSRVSIVRASLSRARPCFLRRVPVALPVDTPIISARVHRVPEDKTHSRTSERRSSASQKLLTREQTGARGR